MKLHLGCGMKILEGFVNIDALPGEDVFVDDAKSLRTFESDSAELIYASHVLEHICRHERLDVLKRWYDILKLGGVLRVAVPDFEKVVKLYKDGTSLDTLIGFLYGGQNYEFNFHYYCWDYQTLSKDLMEVGFTNVRRYDWRKTEHASTDDYSQSYRPHMDKENGELMSLNVEAHKI